MDADCRKCKKDEQFSRCILNCWIIQGGGIIFECKVDRYLLWGLYSFEVGFIDISFNFNLIEAYVGDLLPCYLRRIFHFNYFIDYTTHHCGIPSTTRFSSSTGVFLMQYLSLHNLWYLADAALYMYYIGKISIIHITFHCNVVRQTMSAWHTEQNNTTPIQQCSFSLCLLFHLLRITLNIEKITVALTDRK